MTARQVFSGNDGDVTKAYYAEMNRRGPAGELAVALFRAQKRSTAAKRYRGGKFRHVAYDVKNWSLTEICRIIQKHSLPVTWGWKRDPHTPGFEWVLYVDLPTGQASFHSADRLNGPAYAGEWDGQKGSEEHIMLFCEGVELGKTLTDSWPIIKREPAYLSTREKPEELSLFRERVAESS